MKKINFMMMIIIFLAAGHLVSAQEKALKAEHLFSIDRGHSYIGFSIKYMGYAKVRGRFEDFKGVIIYDETRPEKTSASIVIKTESIDTDHNWRDNDLKSDQWFDAETFPEMSFVSTKVTGNSTGLDVTGELTIRDVTKEVTIKMEPPSGVLADTRGDSQVIFTGETTIDRKEFGVEGKRWSAVKEGLTAVDSKVDIELTILGKRFESRNLENFVRNPESPQGKIYQVASEGGVKEAIKEFAKMKENPDSKVSPNTLNLVGYVLFKNNKIDESLKILNHNTKAFPDYMETFNSLGEVYLAKGDYKKAMQNFNKAIEIDPENLTAKEALRHL